MNTKQATLSRYNHVETCNNFGHFIMLLARNSREITPHWLFDGNDGNVGIQTNERYIDDNFSDFIVNVWRATFYGNRSISGIGIVGNPFPGIRGHSLKDNVYEVFSPVIG